jgi:hypothetical protein
MAEKTRPTGGDGGPNKTLDDRVLQFVSVNDYITGDCPAQAIPVIKTVGDLIALARWRAENLGGPHIKLYRGLLRWLARRSGGAR